jgi:hypothetical protein
MTSQRLPSSDDDSLTRGGLAVLLLGATLGIAAASACGGSDATTTNDYIGATDATPPRLGKSDRADGGP